MNERQEEVHGKRKKEHTNGTPEKEPVVETETRKWIFSPPIPEKCQVHKEIILCRLLRGRRLNQPEGDEMEKETSIGMASPRGDSKSARKEVRKKSKTVIENPLRTKNCILIWSFLGYKLLLLLEA